MVKRYKVKLTDEERETLRALIADRRTGRNRRNRAYILQKADESADGPGWADERVADCFEVGRCTVERVRQRFVEEGLEAALARKPQAYPSRARVLDGANEARLVTLCCETVPKGRSRWTLQLLADRLVELKVVDSVSLETVRQCLKKRTSALAEEDVVHSPGAKRGVRLRHGRRTGSLSAPVRSPAAGGQHG